MPYTAPATFADGNLLSASQLNVLADDIAFLAGIASGVNVPFLSEETVAGGDFTYKYRIRHLHRYLHYQMRQIASTDDSILVKYDGTTIYSDGGNRAAPYTWQSYVDLDATPGGLVIGDWYETYVRVTQVTGSGVTVLDYLLESPSTTL